MMHLLPFHWHVAAIVMILGAVAGHSALVKDHRSRRLFAYAALAFALVVLWPIGDLAASVSLTVATVQRLVIMLLVAPLIVLSLPTTLLSSITRPAFIDPLTRRLSHPGVALVFVTVVGTATVSTPVVDFGASSSWGRGLVVLVVLFTGIVLWIPCLAVMPGSRRLSPIARAGFMFASSLVVTSLSFVWIFSRHSLYPALHNQEALLHMSPVFDQQLAGFVAKLGCYGPMWCVAFIIFSRADRSDRPVDESPLQWADVERQLLRIERHKARQARRLARRGVPDIGVE